jgi:hypothetical protein
MARSVVDMEDPAAVEADIQPQAASQAQAAQEEIMEQQQEPLQTQEAQPALVA